MSDTLIGQLQGAFPPSRRAALDRIALRAKADAAFALVCIGAGAPSTAKRALAVQMALAGDAPPTIAEAVGLSQTRVLQVLENVLTSGFVALYPSFVEDVPLPEGMTGMDLWKLLRPIIETSPSKRGAHCSKWTPRCVLDLLVHDETLQDASVSQVEAVIRNHMDKDRQLVTFSLTEQAHVAAKPIGPLPLLGILLVIAAVFGICVVQKQVSGILFLGAMLVLLALQLFKQILEWRLLRRVLPGKNAPAAPLQPASGPRRTEPLPPPKFTVLHAMSLPPTRWSVDAITSTANALGQPPMRVLYLWVFAAQSDQGGFETEGWPQLGSVHLLLNATAMSIGALAGSTKKLLVADEETLDRTVQGYGDAADVYERPRLFIDGAVGKRPYRGYPIHTLVCNDAVWKPAVHTLAGRCDIAVVNLSGYNPSHPGLEYEIRHLLSGGPPAKFFFIYERNTDADAVITNVLDLWSHLESAPSAVPELVFLRVPDSQEVGYGSQFREASFGTGWMKSVIGASEGEYVPIAPRIVTYLREMQSGRVAS